MKRFVREALFLALVAATSPASPALSLTGDFDRSGSVTLQDAILSLRVAAGMDTTASADPSVAVDGNRAIGTAGALYVLQHLSGLRLPATATVALDAEGVVRSTVSVAGPGGSSLTLQAGTRIALVGEGGAAEPPASEGKVALSLTAPSGTMPPLPEGVVALTPLRIVLTIDDSEREAWFWPPFPGGVEQGLRLTVALPATDGTLGAVGLLFDIAQGRAVRVGSSSLVAGGTTAAAAGATPLSTPLASGDSGSRQMQFSPNRTGTYQSGRSTPGSGTAPAGTFWSRFNVPDPGCASVGSVNVCGPKKVESVEVTEESTAEILADCAFGAGDTATSGVIPPGYQFWCERIPQEDGSTDIRIASRQANLPIIRAKIVLASNDWPMFWTYHRAQGGLNGPDGTVHADPYRRKEFEFAGFKKLTFVTTADKKYDWMRQHALQPLRDAGYTANLHVFTANQPGFTAEIGVYDTLDARVLIEENVVLKDVWTVRKGDETKGNRGTYDHSPKYRGTARARALFPGTTHPVYEITADVTLEKNPALSTETLDVYVASGSVTQRNHTVPVPGCSGTPASITETYPIAGGPSGDLWIKRGGDPLEYLASATLSADAYPLKDHHYKMCCYTECSDETLEAGGQEHMWIMTGLNGAFRTADADGRLKGTFQHITAQGLNAGTYEWDFAPVD